MPPQMLLRHAGLEPKISTSRSEYGTPFSSSAKRAMRVYTLRSSPKEQ